MKELEDLLQERLERLEAGEPLETCLEAAPDEVVAGLRLAARMRALEWPEQPPEHAAAQRAIIFNTPLYKKQKEVKVNETHQNKKSLWNKRLWAPAILAAAFGLAACLLVGGLSARMFFSNRDGRSVIERIPLIGEKAVTWLENTGRSEAQEPDEVLVNNPDEAVLLNRRGLVEWMDEDAQWQAAPAGSVLKAGVHLRTGLLSGAELVFYDGSRVAVGPQAEIVIDRLHANTGKAEREVVLTQLSGESEHHVISSSQAGSRYEVHTPAGVGEARGTTFSVIVNPDQGALFKVAEGKVSVTAQDETVLVESGQATLVNPDEPPAQPQYFFMGQGAVTLIGETWVVAGQALLTYPGTVIIGNPQVGDEVFFEGRMQDDNTRRVDLIVLLSRSPANRFSLTGLVETIGADFWTVNEQQFAVTDITQVDAGIVEGDLVKVEGLIMPDGTLQAETIRRLEDAPGLPFDFVGVVQSIEAEVWIVSDVEVILSEGASLDEGLEVGDLVRVTGWILEDGAWQAESIQRVLDESQAFEFSGEIESIDPWVVSGIPFETREWTFIEEGLEPGDRVSVKGQVMQDGAWVAFEVQRLEDLAEVRIILVGMLTGIDPWVVSGVTLTVDEETLISEDVVLGMLVRVEIRMLEDGTWIAVRIDPMGKLEWADGCREVTAVVVSVSGNQVQLKGWPLLVLGEEAVVLSERSSHGNLQPNSVVLVQICMDEEGNPRIVYVYIILDPAVVEPPDFELPGEKVAICHKPNSKNPHTIVVSQSAAPAHLGHGDILGPCP